MYMGPASRPLVGPASEADVTADQSTFGKAGPLFVVVVGG